MNSPSPISRPSLMGDDDGFASIPLFSGVPNFTNHYQTHPYIMRRKHTFRNSSSPSSASSTTTTTTSPLFAAPHFLESCALCRKPLAGNRDIFMYRGDTPFCSEECRHEQIEMDEANENNWNYKSLCLRLKHDSIKTSSSSTSKAQNFAIRASTLAAA